MGIKLNPRKIKVKALWFDPTVGLNGMIGAILHDGTPVRLCSKEKWDLGHNDSLRKNWTGNTRYFRGADKTIVTDVTEAELRRDGIQQKGRVKAMAIPNELRALVAVHEEPPPITLKDLFFELPPVVHEQLPSQRCAFVEHINKKVTLRIIEQDRTPNDASDGYVDYELSEFLKLPLITLGGTPVIKEQNLPQNARGRLATRAKRRGEAA